MPIISIEIIFNSDSGQINMRGPKEPLLLMDVLLKGVNVCLMNAAKHRVTSVKPVEVADASLLRALPDVEKKSGTP